MKKLIVNADDFGLHPAINAGIIKGCRDGFITSTSLMCSGAAFDDAVLQAKATPALGVGIHLTLVGGGKTLLQARQLRTLVDEDGLLPADYTVFAKRWYAGRIKKAEVVSELQAQLERGLSCGLDAIVAGTAILMMAAVYYRVSTDHAQEGQEDNPIAILDDEKYSSTKSGSKDFSKALDMIKEQATTITDNLNSYDWVGTEGTVLRYLRRVKTTQQADGNLDIESECMKALVYPAESGDGVYEEYFYWGEKLFFAYIWYDETSEYYYYNDGELIRWIDSNGKCHDNEKDNEEFVKRGEKYWNNSLKALKGEGTKTDNGNVSD